MKLHELQERVEELRKVLHDLEITEAKHSTDRSARLKEEIRETKRKIAILESQIQEVLQQSGHLICGSCKIGALGIITSKTVDEGNIFYKRTTRVVHFKCTRCSSEITFEIPEGSKERVNLHTKMLSKTRVIVGLSGIASAGIVIANNEYFVDLVQHFFHDLGVHHSTDTDSLDIDW